MKVQESYPSTRGTVWPGGTTSPEAALGCHTVSVPLTSSLLDKHRRRHKHGNPLWQTVTTLSVAEMSPCFFLQIHDDCRNVTSAGLELRPSGGCGSGWLQFHSVAFSLLFFNKILLHICVSCLWHIIKYQRESFTFCGRGSFSPWSDVVLFCFLKTIW